MSGVSQTELRACILAGKGKDIVQKNPDIDDILDHIGSILKSGGREDTRNLLSRPRKPSALGLDTNKITGITSYLASKGYSDAKRTEFLEDLPPRERIVYRKVAEEIHQGHIDPFLCVSGTTLPKTVTTLQKDMWESCWVAPSDNLSAEQLSAKRLSAEELTAEIFRSETASALNLTEADFQRWNSIYWFETNYEWIMNRIGAKKFTVTDSWTY